MKVYKFDKLTKEYKGIVEAFKDTVSSMRAGKDIYVLPAYTTKIAPPKVKEGEIAVFTGEEWKIVANFRGQMVYNLNTREGKVWDQLGPLPKGFSTKLPERIEDVRINYLQTMKTNFDVCLTNTKLKIPSTELYFNYNSVERLKNEQNIGIQMSRDDSNKIYMLTRQEYDVIINYLVVYGQYMYLQKWILENAIKKCESLEILKTYSNKLDFKVDQKQINNLVKLSPDKRKEYFNRMASAIK